jgi:phage N-6-adenine-methyltransferase
VALELGHELMVEDADSPWRLRPWQKAAASSATRGRGSRPHIPAAQTDLWNTPRDLLASLREEFDAFDLDVAALASTSVAPAYLGPDHPDPRRRDALAFEHWADLVPAKARVFCNPPYSLLPEFTRVASATAERGVTTVALLPVRSSARFWHERVLHQPGVEVRYLPGRLKFLDANGKSDNAAPFASAVVVFWGSDEQERTG